MTADSSWVPPDIDTDKANIARVYDWWLGGTHNFRADQDTARSIIAVEPATRAVMRANRAFLGRAVRYLAGEAGIRQFLDIGSGIPTQRNVHQVAQGAAPGTRVVYVDNDDVAVAHSQLILDGNPDATAICADLRSPEKILAHPETRRLIDFTRPVGLIFAAVLHFVPGDDHPQEILAAFRDALAPGSHLAISHGCRDITPSVATAIENVYNSRVGTRSVFRTHEEIARLFDGFTLVEPGLVWLCEWRPDGPDNVFADPAKSWMKAGVARYDAP